MTRLVQILPLLILAVASGGKALADNDKDLPGCRASREFLPLARLYSEIQADSDSHVVYKEMKRVRRLACSGEYSQGQTINYPGASTATLYAGKDGATWNWANGRTITLYSYRNGATWSWPNGQTMTLYAYRMDATWYWPNGRTMTTYAGRKGATYYDPDGQVADPSGPEMKKSNGELDMDEFVEFVEGLSAEMDDPQIP